MALHAVPVSVIGCKNEALKKKKITLKAVLSASKNENIQVTRNTILISPLDCSHGSGRILVNQTVYSMVMFGHIYLDGITALISKHFVFLAVY